MLFATVKGDAASVILVPVRAIRRRAPCGPALDFRPVCVCKAVDLMFGWWWPFP